MISVNEELYSTLMAWCLVGKLHAYRGSLAPFKQGLLSPDETALFRLRNEKVLAVIREQIKDDYHHELTDREIDLGIGGYAQVSRTFRT